MIDPVMPHPDRPLVLRCGTATRHPPGDTIDTVTPSDYFVVMLFLTRFEAETSSGRKQGEAGDMMINPPGSRQWHRGIDGGEFKNDWIHLSADAVQRSMQQAGLPLNMIFHVSDSGFTGRIIGDIMREQLLNTPISSELAACRVTELILLTHLFWRMAGRVTKSPIIHTHYERLLAIRLAIREAPADLWTVDRMARTAHLSASRFAALYRNFFRVAPMEDVISSRLEEAKRLLVQGRMTVSEVAERCGFSHLNYFSRLFKARTGQSPGQYRS
jgi:AraC-like DNA-binding protein